ncbi:MAG TPA: cytochrome oxidase subunit III [Bacteroidetes bacterium]|nr:cytochrome oxidase subunit III [Bacteroidota bacterium]
MSSILVNNMNSEEFKHNKIHSKKLLLWFALGSITMMFTALLSAYVYKQSSGHWIYIDIPASFLYNTMIIVLSSVTIQWAHKLIKGNDLIKAKNLLLVTFFLGICFLLGQYFSWKEMVSNEVYLIDPRSVSGSFVYILSGLHALHIIGGIIALLIMVTKALKNKLNIHNILGLELTLTYWHYLGLLWVYIYVFLLVNQN